MDFWELSFMSRMMGYLGLAFFLSISGCRTRSGDAQSTTRGVIGVSKEIKPFSKMRSANELHQMRLGLTSKRALSPAVLRTQTPTNVLRNIVMDQIIEIDGIPRVQLKSVLENIISSKSTACAGVACGRIFGLESGKIDEFLDESLEKVKSMEPSAKEERIKEVLVGSLLKNDSATPPSWVITLVPDPDSRLWKSSTDSPDLSPDFPARPGEKDGFQVTPEFRASVTWSKQHEDELNSWKKEFDSVEDCETRGIKRGKVYASFNDCLAEASLEERQFLSAKLVFDEIEEKLAKVDGNVNPRRNFRAVFDKDGHMQCLVVTNKKPSVPYYSSHYEGAIPKGATQIPALEVAYLLAAPWNLRQEHPKKVKGAGSACLGIAAMESKRGPWAGRIILEGSPSAVPYYQKLGFTAIGETFDKHYGLLPAMWLEPKDTEKLIPAHLKE